MIKIIGSTHLTSKEAIEGIIKDFNPDVIGVELCETRFKVFTGQINSKKKSEELIDKISDEIKKKAEEEQLDYGSDQKTAMFYALNNNIPLLLVDKDINDIRNSMSRIPQEEMIFLQKELTRFKGEKLNKEVNEEEVIRNMRDNIPNVFKILVEERNNYIVNKIKEGNKKYPDKRIIIFLGSGHVKQVEELLR